MSEADAPTGVQELDAHHAKWLQLYTVTAAKIKELEEQKALARDELVAYAKINEASELTLGGYTVGTVKNKATTRFDTKKFKEVEPDLYTQYLVKGETTEFRVK